MRYLMMGILVLLVVAWFFLPKVTEHDAKAFAHAIFLEYCTEYHVNPRQYDPIPDFSVEPGKNDEILYTYRFQSGNLDTVVIQIDRWGESTISREARITEPKREAS